MPAAPDISIVVPCYNASQTVGRTLASVRAQTHADLEVVCVDDGSTDSTARIVGRFAARDPRIRLVQAPHRGLAAARNLGLAHARAPYVLPLDADDVMRPDAAATLLAVARAYEPRSRAARAGRRLAAPAAPLVAAGYEHLDRHGRPLGSFHFPAVREFCVERLLAGNPLSPMTLIPHALLGSRPFDETLPACEDWDLWLRLASRGATCVALPRVLFGYRLRSASLSHRADLMHAAGCRVIERWMPAARDPAVVADAPLRWAFACGALALASGVPGALPRYLRGAALHDVTDGLLDCFAGSLYGAFLFVHGAQGRSWRRGSRVWQRRIESWLRAGPLAPHADAILQRLRRMPGGWDPALRAVRGFVRAGSRAGRTLIYGLGQNGLALIEHLRRDRYARVGRLRLADDAAPESTFAALRLPRDDPRTWTRWPRGTRVIVTPNAAGAMETTLRRAGGRAGVDYLVLARWTALTGGAPPASGAAGSARCGSPRVKRRRARPRAARRPR